MATLLLTAFQELATRLRASGSGPTTVEGTLVQEYAVILSAIIQAHREIVTEHIDWDFLYNEGLSFTAVNGGNPHSPGDLASIRHYIKGTFYYDGDPLTEIDWLDYRSDKFDSDDFANDGPPEAVIIKPDKTLIIYPEPDQNYTISYDAWFKHSLTETDLGNVQIPDEHLEALYKRAHAIWLGEEEAPNYVKKMQEFAVAFEALEDSYWPGKMINTLSQGQDIVVVPE